MRQRPAYLLHIAFYEHVITPVLDLNIHVLLTNKATNVAKSTSKVTELLFNWYHHVTTVHLADNSAPVSSPRLWRHGAAQTGTLVGLLSGSIAQHAQILSSCSPHRASEETAFFSVSLSRSLAWWIICPKAALSSRATINQASLQL